MSNQVNTARHNARKKVKAAPPPDQGATVATVRPKVKELLAEYQADPTGDAGTIVEALVLAQVASEPEREAEMLFLHQARERYHNLENEAGRSATRLTRQNHRLKRELAKKTAAQDHVRRYLEEVGAAARSGKELSTQEIYDKISAAIGMGDVVIPRVEKDHVPHA